MRPPTLKPSTTKTPKAAPVKSLMFHSSEVDAQALISTLNFQASLIPTRHSQERATEYSMEVPSHLSSERLQVVEVEQTNGRNTKLLVRFAYNETTDIILAIRPVSVDRYIILTLWDMASNDQRVNVNLNNYNLPKNYKEDFKPFGQFQ